MSSGEPPDLPDPLRVWVMAHRVLGLATGFSGLPLDGQRVDQDGGALRSVGAVRKAAVPGPCQLDRRGGNLCRRPCADAPSVPPRSAASPPRTHSGGEGARPSRATGPAPGGCISGGGVGEDEGAETMGGAAAGMSAAGSTSRHGPWSAVQNTTTTANANAPQSPSRIVKRVERRTWAVYAVRGRRSASPSARCRGSASASSSSANRSSFRCRRWSCSSRPRRRCSRCCRAWCRCRHRLHRRL
jgi:hypothetical protein